MTVTLEVANPAVLALLRDMESLNLVQMKAGQDESAASPRPQKRVFEEAIYLFAGNGEGIAQVATGDLVVVISISIRGASPSG